MSFEQCQAIVWERDTLRYTGRGPGGFQMHYRRHQCKRRALVNGLCWQHDGMEPPVLRVREWVFVKAR